MNLFWIIHTFSSLSGKYCWSRHDESRCDKRWIELFPTIPEGRQSWLRKDWKKISSARPYKTGRKYVLCIKAIHVSWNPIYSALSRTTVSYWVHGLWTAIRNRGMNLPGEVIDYPTFGFSKSWMSRLLRHARATTETTAPWNRSFAVFDRPTRYIKWSPHSIPTTCCSRRITTHLIVDCPYNGINVFHRLWQSYEVESLSDYVYKRDVYRGWSSSSG